LRHGQLQDALVCRISSARVTIKYFNYRDVRRLGPNAPLNFVRRKRSEDSTGQYLAQPTSVGTSALQLEHWSGGPFRCPCRRQVTMERPFVWSLSVRSGPRFKMSILYEGSRVFDVLRLYWAKQELLQEEEQQEGECGGEHQSRHQRLLVRLELFVLKSC